MSAATGEAPRRATFGRDRRLLHKKEFEAVLRDPWVRFRRGPLWCAAKANAHGQSRLGLIVAKRVLRRAVDRNRAKRVLREAFRLRQGTMAVDVVVRLVVATPPLDAKAAERLFEALDDILGRRAGRSC